MFRLRPASFFGLALVTALLLLGGVYAGPVESRGAGASLTEITELEDIIEALNESIKSSEQKIEQLAGKIASTERQIEQAEKEIADAEARLEENTRLLDSGHAAPIRMVASLPGDPAQCRQLW